VIDTDYGNTRNFATAAGEMALINGASADTSPDLRFDNQAGYTIITVETTGIYEFSYHVNYRAVSASPDIEQLVTFFALSGGFGTACNQTTLENATTGIAITSLSMIVNDQRFYAISSNDVGFFNAGTCLALRAYEVDDVTGNEAEMVAVKVTARRL